MIRASASYTSVWGSFVLLKMDRVRVAWGGSLSTLHRLQTNSYQIAGKKFALAFACEIEYQAVILY